MDPQRESSLYARSRPSQVTRILQQSANASLPTTSSESQESLVLHVLMPLFLTSIVCLIVAFIIVALVLLHWRDRRINGKFRQQTVVDTMSSDTEGRVHGIPNNETSTTARDASADSSGVEPNFPSILRSPTRRSRIMLSRNNRNLTELEVLSESSLSHASMVSTMTGSFVELDDDDDPELKRINDAADMSIFGLTKKGTRGGSSTMLSHEPEIFNHILTVSGSPGFGNLHLTEQEQLTPVKKNTVSNPRDDVSEGSYVLESRGDDEAGSKEREGADEEREQAAQLENIISTIPVQMGRRKSCNDSATSSLLDETTFVREVLWVPEISPSDVDEQTVLGVEISDAEYPTTFPTVTDVHYGSPLEDLLFEGDYVIRLNDVSTEGLDRQQVWELIREARGRALKMTVVNFSGSVSDTDATLPTRYSHGLMEV